MMLIYNTEVERNDKKMAKTIITLDIELRKIVYDPQNNRDIDMGKHDDDKKEKAAIEILAENIREHGLLSPIIICKFTGLENNEFQYKIIVGNRRFKAYEMLAQTEKKYLKIPSIVRDITSEEEKKYIQLSENISRKELTEDEKTVAICDLYQELNGEAIENKIGYEEIAQKIGVSTSYVQNLCKIKRESKIESIIDKSIINKICNVTTIMTNSIKSINDLSIEDKLRLKSETKLLHSKMKEVLAELREIKKTIAKDEEVIKEQVNKDLLKRQEKQKIKVEKVKNKIRKQKDKVNIIPQFSQQ